MRPLEIVATAGHGAQRRKINLASHCSTRAPLFTSLARTSGLMIPSTSSAHYLPIHTTKLSTVGSTLQPDNMLSPPSAHKLSEKFAVNIVGHDVASSRVPTPNIPPPPPVRYHTCTSLDLDDYFVGPRDMHKHSKLPYFMRVHGSVLPKMLLPLSFVVGWTTGVTCVNRYVQPLGIHALMCKPGTSTDLS